LRKKAQIFNKHKKMKNQDFSQTKWLSSEEVCHLLMISKRSLQTYRDRGILPFAQIGRKIYYKATDIEAYLEAHYIKARFQGGDAA
jgi:excisionase family DNA binding protein